MRGGRSMSSRASLRTSLRSSACLRPPLAARPLINRIKADPTLTACEIRIVAYDSNYVRVAPLDQRGTRRAPRVGIVDGVEVQIDGNPAFLVNLSLVGADVVSVTILKPNQHVRVTLADPRRPMRIRSAVVWELFEMPKGIPRYRAGIEFFDADQDAVARFIEANKR